MCFNELRIAMAFRDYVADKILASTSSWTKKERLMLPQVLAHIRKNNAVVKWHINARYKNVSFTEFCRGSGDYALPRGEAWLPENMKNISYCAAMQLDGHMCIAFLINSTWHSMGLFPNPDKKVKNEYPEFKPIVDKKTLAILRKVIPSVTDLLKQTTLVEFIMPDVMLAACWLEPYETVRDENKATIYDKKFYEAFEEEIAKATSEINVVWCGLCPQTTKAALEKIKFEDDPLTDANDHYEQFGSRFVNHTNRARPLVAKFLDADTLNVGAGYSTVLNNCVKFVESLTGIPCNGLGLHLPGLCRFDRKKMPPNFGFLETDMSAAAQSARAGRSTAMRLADWIVSCNAEEITDDIMTRGRTLAAIATFDSKPLLCIGFASTGEGLCNVTWVTLYFTTDGFQLVVLPKSTDTVRKRIKVYAIADATNYLIELSFVVEWRKETGSPLNSSSVNLEALVRAHNFLTEEMNGLWDMLFNNKKDRSQRALALIEEFKVA